MPNPISKDFTALRVTYEAVVKKYPVVMTKPWVTSDIDTDVIPEIRRYAVAALNLTPSLLAVAEAARVVADIDTSTPHPADAARIEALRAALEVVDGR